MWKLNICLENKFIVWDVDSRKNISTFFINGKFKFIKVKI